MYDPVDGNEETVRDVNEEGDRENDQDDDELSEEEGDQVSGMKNKFSYFFLLFKTFTAFTTEWEFCLWSGLTGKWVAFLTQ